MCVDASTTSCTYLEGLLIDVRIISHIRFPGLAKEDEFLKEKNVAETLSLPECHQELVLTYERALLFQIDLQQRKENRGHIQSCHQEKKVFS